MLMFVCVRVFSCLQQLALDRGFSASSVAQMHVDQLLDIAIAKDALTPYVRIVGFAACVTGEWACTQPCCKLRREST